ncbi:MAG: glycoside hydrolase family 9 protein [Phycisphaerae bacterium]|nr:glycoside hydrolase family 9 protein [Phycisphaerae bacterium]
MKRVLAISLIAVIAANLVAAQEGKSLPKMPIPEQYEHSIRHRWLNKPILECRMLDDMEDPATWQHRGFGKMTFVDTPVVEGKKSLKLTSPTKGDKLGGNDARPWGAATAIRTVAGEDWTDWNRLSFRVYPDLPGFKVVSLNLTFHNGGAEKVPGPYGRNGLNFVILENQQWNHIVWEIAHLGRDKVTGVEFSYRLQGNEPGAAETVTFYIDQLELQKVAPDHYEGWNVAPGQIAYCHSGYPPASAKIALASDLTAGEFSLVDAKSGCETFRGKVVARTTPLGRFQIMDFTTFDLPGEYILRAGDRSTRPFAISNDAWRDSIVKTINHFYCQRCGQAIEGIHDVCHKDWMCAHGDRNIHINGGWHDAGDLSQGLVNTSEGVYAMLALADALQTRDPLVSKRLIEESQWGLDWVLKTRFGDGFRCNWATMDFWTDGIPGTVDDVTARAGNSPFENFMAASAEALAARMLRDIDREKAEASLAAAREDWQFAMNAGRRDRLDTVAAALNASLDLYDTLVATGDATAAQRYKEAAIEMARSVVDCQQQAETDMPFKGFFYTAPDKRQILHYSHRGHEQAPITGLIRLCRQFDSHADFPKWHAAIALYAEYYKAVCEYTQPWAMLPAGIYDLQEARDDTTRTQIKNGTRLTDRYYLRRFPTWRDFRGNCGTVLSQTKGLAAAARYLNDPELLQLCQLQIQWVLGFNPFCQSLMYGEGYDFAPQYTAMSGDLVGGLPVGVQTHFDRDEPYWPTENCYNWKEIWVHPSSRWLWIMSDLYAGQ